MTLPNAITLMRVVLVPVIVWALLNNQIVLAFALFLIAGISDAVDGILARWLDQHSELGTILDPVADKVMLVAVFVVLGTLGHLPSWLVILVVSRDVLIVAGIIIAFLIRRPLTIKPLWISKANTVLQIVLAVLVIGLLALEIRLPMIKGGLEIATGVLTAASALAYMVQGLKHMAGDSDAA